MGNTSIGKIKISMIFSKIINQNVEIMSAVNVAVQGTSSMLLLPQLKWCKAKILQSFLYLSEQEGEGSEGKRPAILVGEVDLTALCSVQHLIIYAGDVQYQTHH